MSEEDRVVIIRFGHDWDPTCMVMDETLYRCAEKMKNFAVVYLVDITEVKCFSHHPQQQQQQQQQHQNCSCASECFRVSLSGAHSCGRHGTRFDAESIRSHTFLMESCTCYRSGPTTPTPSRLTPPLSGDTPPPSGLTLSF